MKGRTFVFFSHVDGNLYRFRLPLMKRLVSLGAHVFAIAGPGRSADRFEEHGVTFVPLAVDRKTYSPFAARRTIRDLSGLLKETRADVLQAFTLRPNLYGALAAKRAGTTIAIATVTGLGSLYVETKALGPKVRRNLVDGVTRAGLRAVSAVVFQNEDDKQYYLSHRICRPDQAQLIVSSGVDLREFSPESVSEERRTVLREAWGLGTELPVVMMVARLVAPKGVREFLEVAKRLRGRARFVLIGGGDPGNPTAIPQDEIQKFSQSDIVIAPGRQENIPEWLSIADIYALPSYYREGVPRSILEAMAMRLPVVTTDHPGCRETVEEGANGLLVPPRSAEGLEGAVRRLIEGRELRARMGDASLTLARTKFAAETIVDEYIDLYRRLGMD
jgi:N,N'-diacetylbacillosaminyl-diphospho-undecaprenol alpha-1,3-N-acetylgalactosaminyltransferase